MTRNEEIIKELEDNGFVKQGNRNTYYKEIEMKNWTSTIGKIKVYANCEFDDEDMEYSYVDFNIECDVDGDIDNVKQIADELSICCEELYVLQDTIDGCASD